MDEQRFDTVSNRCSSIMLLSISPQLAAVAQMNPLRTAQGLRPRIPVVGSWTSQARPHEPHQAQHCPTGTQPPLPPMTGTSFKQQTSPGSQGSASDQPR